MEKKSKYNRLDNVVDDHSSGNLTQPLTSNRNKKNGNNAIFKIGNLIKYNTTNGWKDGEIVLCNPDGTYNIRQESGITAYKWKEKDVQLRTTGKKKLDVWRLLTQARPELVILTFGTIALVLGALLNLLTPAFVGTIIDSISGNHSTSSGGQITQLIRYLGWTTQREILNVAVIGLGISIATGSFFTFLRAYLYTLAGTRVVARLRKQLFNALIMLDVAFYDETRVGELTNRLGSDTTILKNATTINISMGLRFLVTVIGGVIYLFVISWKLTLVMLSVVPFVAISGRVYGGALKKLATQVQESLAESTVVADESLSHIRTVKVFSREEHHEKTYNERIQRTYSLGAKIGALVSIFMGGIGFLGSGSVVLVLWYGSMLVLKGEMSPGLLTSFALYTITIGFNLAGLAGLFATMLKAVGANQRVFQLLDTIPEISNKGGTTLPIVKGNVKFSHVSFSYPSRPDSIVLNDVSLELFPGTVTALVGPSGGGKSTIVRLLERLYDANQGSITLDGYNIKELNLPWMHRQLGLVGQEPVLFGTTIRENICYGVDHSFPNDHMTVEQAAQIANAHEFIIKFKDGYETLVGERGVTLSGGQKQRVAIARAVLKNPKVLIADEATSALDAESEFRVQEALDRLMKGRTVLVVAHRLSTVKDADCVCVIEQGKIVEKGTHSELLQLSGAYTQLVKRQLTNSHERGDQKEKEENSPCMQQYIEHNKSNVTHRR